MTTFFNKKEEVLEIKLTSWGKELYSNGMLKPAYYAFFDSDVIYDDEYGCSEGNVDQRIKETPRTKIQIHTSPLETTTWQKRVLPDEQRTAGIKATMERVDDPTTIEFSRAERAKRMDIHQPIGSSGNFSKYYPAWRSYLLLGDTSEVQRNLYFSNETGSVINIPQIDVKKRLFTSRAIAGTDANSSVYGHIFPDGSSLTLKEDEDSEFLLFLEEKNATSDNKNFDIEIYRIEIDETTGDEILHPLKFRAGRPFNKIVDGMIMDNDPAASLTPATIDSSMVENYFDVETDSEINRDVLRRALSSGRFANISDLESLVSAFGIAPADITTSGGPSSDIYGMSLDEIAQMDEENLEDASRGIYDEEDNTNACD